MPELPINLLNWWNSAKDVPGWSSEGFGILAHPNTHNGLSWQIIPLSHTSFGDHFLQSISSFYFAASEGPLIFPTNTHKPSDTWFFFISTMNGETLTSSSATAGITTPSTCLLDLDQPPLDLNSTPLGDAGSSLLRKRIPHATLTLEYVQKRLKFFAAPPNTNPNPARKAADSEPSHTP